MRSTVRFRSTRRATFGHFGHARCVLAIALGPDLFLAESKDAHANRQGSELKGAFVRPRARKSTRKLLCESLSARVCEQVNTRVRECARVRGCECVIMSWLDLDQHMPRFFVFPPWIPPGYPLDWIPPRYPLDGIRCITSKRTKYGSH
eukprot:1181944-Prorocentrum_minimum.AAC.2